MLDRRNMLIGLGGLYGSTLALPNTLPANADPMAPDVTACTLTDALWDGSVADSCCPPKFDPTKIKDFKFEDYPSPILKIRRPAHTASYDQEFVRDYNRAIEIMRTGLSPQDPRSFYQQAKIHCAYCDDAYPQFNNPDKRLEVHNSWLFASFHRWYMFFYERILGKLINKPDFALPFWNWDHPDGMRVPEMFKDVHSSLYDSNRNVEHLSSVIDFNLFSRPKDGPVIPDDQLISENLQIMRKQMVYPTIPSVFFGEKYKLGDDIDRTNGAGALESSPHNVVHAWMGSATVSGGQDMGSFWSSGRDPIFYCHHSNVDRMWHVWRTQLPGPRVNIYEPDYLNAWFVFYDENANPVRVYIRDSFDIEKLGYTYEKVDLPWTFSPVPGGRVPTKTRAKILSSSSKINSVTFPKALDSVIKTQVARPGKQSPGQQKQEEVLVVDFDTMPTDEFVKFDVYINDTLDREKDEDSARVTPELAGSYNALAHRAKHMMTKGAMKKDEKKKMMMIRKSCLKLALNTLLEEIGDEDSDVLEVTIAPRSGTQGIEITSIKIVYASD
ncbi:hypothetical protein vseg_001997 [Gypsophila vaccaria]